MKTHLLVCCVVLGALLVAIGAALVYRPAGLVVAGVELAVAGLIVDDGKPANDGVS